MTLQPIDKKKNIFFYFLILLFLSTISNISLDNKSNSLLKIKHIEVNGLDIDFNTKIRKKLNYLIGQNIFFLDKKDITNKLNNINYIENYKVLKYFPSKLQINLKKTKLLAVTFKDDKLLYVGSNKKLIYLPKKIPDKSLPMIFGNYSNEEFFNLRFIMIESKFDIKKIKEYYYFPSKRWDLKLIDGILVKLPIENINKSINMLDRVLKENIRGQNKIIDLRVPNQIIFSDE